MIRLFALFLSFILATPANAVVGAAAYMARQRLLQQSFQLNASGALDLTNRDVCDLSHRDYNRLSNCKPGDVVLMGFAEDSKTMQRIFKTCKMDEPIYILRWQIACVYEEKDVNIYRPKAIKKKKQTEPPVEEEPKPAPEKSPSDHVE